MPRGRPRRSATRDRIAEILAVIERGTGYDIFKVYRQVFGQITSRSIYYNLHQGVLLDLFELDEIATESGSFSWGPKAEKKYYRLGRKAKPMPEDTRDQAIAKTWSSLKER